MTTRRRRLRWLLGVVIATVIAGGCALEPPESLASVDTSPEPLSVVRIASYDGAPLDHALDDWKRDHPTVRVEVEVRDIDVHHRDLLDGAIHADLVAIDHGWLGEFAARSADFADTADALGPLPGVLAAPHIEESLTVNGRIWARPASVGGLVLAWRTDLLGAELDLAHDAGWCDVIEFGDHQVETTGVRFLPESSVLFRATLEQASIVGAASVIDENGEPDVEHDPAVHRAWDLTMTALGHEALFGDPCGDLEVGRIAGNLPRQSAAWADALEAGEFSASLAPAWLLPRLVSGAAERESVWATRPIPGVHGDDGGTSWAIPEAAIRQDLAESVLAWLTSSTMQREAWERGGHLPADATIDGLDGIDLFAASTAQRAPIRRPGEQAVIGVLVTAIERVESGNAEPAEAWADALFRIDRLS